MDFRIIDRDSLDLERWELLAAEGSFFHTHYWADVCVKGLMPGASAVFLCGFEGDSLVAGMPAIIKKKFGMRAFHSMPFGTYGEVILAAGSAPEAKTEFYRHLEEYFKRSSFSRVNITDFAGRFADWDESSLTKDSCFTHIISLNGREPYRPPDKKIEGHIRTGQRAGTRIVQIETPGQIDSFYRLFRMTEQRHGRQKPLYAKKFFLGLLEVLGGSKKLIWPGMMANGDLVGSCINFVHADTLFNWQTVSDYEMRHFKPNHILLNETILEGISAGVSKINLGASPQYSQGLIDYKERWGGMRVDYDIYTSTSWIRKLLRR